MFLDEPAHDHSGIEGLEVVLSVDDVPGGAHALRAGGETPGVTAVRNLGDGLGRGRRVRLGRGGVARVVTAVIVAAVVVVVVAVFVQQIATDAASGFARVLVRAPARGALVLRGVEVVSKMLGVRRDVIAGVAGRKFLSRTYCTSSRALGSPRT